MTRMWAIEWVRNLFGDVEGGDMENRQIQEMFRALQEQSHAQFVELRALLTDIHRHEGQILRNQEKIMSTLDEVLADVTEEGTKLDSLSTFIAGLKQQIADALSGATLPPAVQAKVDAVFAGVESNKAKVQAALDANVPPPP